MSERDPMSHETGAQDRTGADGHGEADGPRRHPPTWIGWAARAIALGLVALLVGVLGFEMMQPAREVAIRVEPQWDAARDDGGTVLVPVDITNDGSRAIRDLALELDGGAGEPVEVEIDLMGAAETVTYVAAFDARPARIEQRIIRYEAP